MRSNGMGGIWPGLIGPYGGTKESEFWRPVKMAIACVFVIVIMLLVMLIVLALAGDFTGPVLLIGAVLLTIAPQQLGKERTPVQKMAITVFLWASIGITLFTIYLGGMPIRYYKQGERLVVSWQESSVEEWYIEDVRIIVEGGEFWLLTDEYSLGLGPTNAPESSFALVAQPQRRDGWRMPLWLEAGRWMFVIVGVCIQCLGTILLARLITEMLFPSLPNSIRAKPGLLARIFPFMKIKNVEYAEDEPDDYGSVEPEGGESAPWIQ
jgi:hypothetical protein